MFWSNTSKEDPFAENAATLGSALVKYEMRLYVSIDLYELQIVRSNWKVDNNDVGIYKT